MILKNLAVGPLESNCYIIGDETARKALVVDPGDEPDRIMELLKSAGLSLESVLCTHAHFDHVGALPELKAETGCRILLHRDEIEIYRAAADMAAFWGHSLDNLPEPDQLLSEGDAVSVGGLAFRVLHTPGHSPGGICLYGEGIVFTGDTLFAGSVGRTDFYGGDSYKLKASFRRLMELPSETVVLAGHGPASTIGRERSDNFFGRGI